MGFYGSIQLLLPGSVHGAGLWFSLSYLLNTLSCLLGISLLLDLRFMR